MVQPKTAPQSREKLPAGLAILLPHTESERRWWGVVSVGAGISEELAFRGFFFYYVSTYLPQMGTLEKVALSGIVFGFAHLYQGRGGVIGTGILGLAFAGLYVVTGSLMLPVLVHAAVDLRALLILPPAGPQAFSVEVTA